MPITLDLRKTMRYVNEKRAYCFPKSIRQSDISGRQHTAVRECAMSRGGGMHRIDAVCRDIGGMGRHNQGGEMRAITTALLSACLIGLTLPSAGFAQTPSKNGVKQESKTSKSGEKQQSKSAKNGKNARKSSKDEKKTAPQVPPEEIIKFSDEQIMLNNQAVDAGNAGDYKKAEQLLMAMLQGGEMNIIWGNLGSLYAKQGKCIEAKDAFERVWTSPKITEIPAESIEQGALQAMEKLAEQCSARVVLRCSPSDMTVTFDEGNPFECTSEALEVTPGKHFVLGKTSYGFNGIEIEGVAGETRNYTLEVIDYERIASDAGVSPEQLRDRSKRFKIIGYSFLGTGTAALVAGGVLLWDGQSKYQKKLDEYNKTPGKPELNEAANAEREKSQKKFNAAYGLFAAGGALVISGVTLVVYDALKIRPQIEEFEKSSTGFTWNVAPAIAPEYAGFAFSGRF